jgi:hypothetical protein
VDLLNRAWVCAAAALAVAGCTKESHPIGGLHSASAPVYLIKGNSRRPIAVGSTLRNDDRIQASGPAMLEFFQGGAMRFLAQGDEMELGDLPEAKLMSTNFPSVLVRGKQVLEVAPSKRPVAARYTDTNFTPMTAIKEPGTGDYLQAFFTPNGIEKLGGGGPQPEGPRQPLPPPPLRPHVPHIHAGDLGGAGPVVDVSGGSAAAETDDFATALLLDGSAYQLGRSERLFVPKGVSVTVHWADKSSVSVDGPVEVHLH